MSLLRSLAHVDNDTLNEVLSVLDVGVDQLKGEVDTFPLLMSPGEAPEQYLPYLVNLFGLSGLRGLSEPDTRALLTALGVAYRFKGGIHGMRLAVRALWRFATITESFQAIYAAGVADEDGPEAADEWQAWLADEGYTESDLLEVLVRVELEADDAREYGEKQATEFQSLLEQLRFDSGWGSILRTYRPGFENSLSTTLGTSQFDGDGILDNAYLLYGRTTAFVDGSSQAILDALRWNIYPDFKMQQSQSILQHFLPLDAHVTYQSQGYKQFDDLTVYPTEQFTTIPASDVIAFIRLSDGSGDLVKHNGPFTFTSDSGFDRDSGAYL